MTAQLVESAGLLCDIVGAIWVVKSVIRGRDDELANAADASAVWAGPDPTPRPAMLKLLMDARRDARIGAVLLVIGFVGQLVAAWL